MSEPAESVGGGRRELGTYRGYRLYAVEDGRVRGYAVRNVQAGRSNHDESLQATGNSIEEVDACLRKLIDDESSSSL